MRDLESQIAQWRRDMRAGGLKSAVLDELEAHLRDAVELRMQAGMGAQEAIDTAARRLGAATELRSEFRKIQYHLIMKPHVSRRLTEMLTVVALIAIQISLLLPLVQKMKMREAVSGWDISVVVGWGIALVGFAVYYVRLRRRQKAEGMNAC
jgi:hypothetical protein